MRKVTLLTTMVLLGAISGCALQPPPPPTPKCADVTVLPLPVIDAHAIQKQLTLEQWNSLHAYIGRLWARSDNYRDAYLAYCASDT